LQLLSADRQFVALDLPRDSFTREFLEQVASAEKRVMNYGEGGKRKLKISTVNTRDIGDILKLYDAVLQDLNPPQRSSGQNRE